MKNSKLNTQLDNLAQIQKLEVPAFLFTRIQQQIKNKSQTELKPTLNWVVKLSFIFILALNIGVLVQQRNKNKQELNLIETMNLLPDNSFYNE